MKSGFISLAASLAGLCAPLLASAADFTPLGDLAGGTFLSSAQAISADGSTIVGQGRSDFGPEAASWNSSAGVTGLGDLNGGNFTSIAYGVSADGSTIVGQGVSTLGDEGFIWTAGSMSPIGHLAGGGTVSAAYAVSNDGSTVIGYSDSSSGSSEAFSWTSGGGMVPLGDLDGGSIFSIANAISGDGSVIVGYAESGSSLEAFRLPSGGSMQGIGHLAGGGVLSFAWGISDDGSTIVGASDSSQGISEAFVWTNSSGIMPLGDLPDAGTLPPDNDFHSSAWDVSGDGSIVVGTGTRVLNTEAFVWTMATGLQSILDIATSQGATIPAGWTLLNAYGISPDGSSIVGDGTNPDNNKEAWLITGLQLQDDDNDGIINIEDNCINVPNGPGDSATAGPSQYDSNGDGYGNACDADFNGDLVVNGIDVGPFVGQFGTIGPDADFNGDGVVNGLDVGTFVNSFGLAPGPSGIAP